MIRDALIVTHGMGDQVRFQAIDSIVQGLKQHRPAQIVDPVRARSVQHEDGPVLQCAEVTFNVNGVDRELHIYEAYWAPLTEGNVGAWDAVRFLLSGGLNGVIKGGSVFWRELFGQPVAFPIRITSTIGIAAVALAIASLLLINFVAAGVVVRGWSEDHATSGMWNDFITVIGVVVWTLAGYAALLMLSRATKARDALPRPRYYVARLFSALAHPAMFGVLTAVIAAGFAIAVIAIRRNVADSETLWAAARERALLWVALTFVITWFLSLWNGPSERLEQLLRVVTRLAGTVCGLLALITLALWFLAILPAGGPAPLFTAWFRSRISISASPYRWWAAAALTAYVIAACIAFFAQDPARDERQQHAALRVVMAALASVSFPLLVYLIVATATTFLGTIQFPQHRPLYLIPWIAVLGAGYLVRNFLVKYVGDVAAYVSSHKLDRFHEVRSKIKETIDGVFRTVYFHEENGQLSYRHIGVAGHSLGSVISFDALNSILLDEALHPARDVPVRDRTTLLLTFGSPLDKVAYVYSTLASETDMTREKLTAAAKPLIGHAPARQGTTWINVWSPSDVISGPLNYYDPPPTSPPSPAAVPRVVNVCDGASTTPLAAHNEYYDNSLLFEVIARWHTTT